MSAEQTSLPLTSSAGASHVRMSRWLDAVRDWLESGADCGGSSIASFASSLPVGSSSRTSLACYRATEDGTLPPSFTGWRSSGTGGPTGFLTLDTSESRSGAVACSLSDILEARVHPRYYLSPKACAGILRRAEKRGRELPAQLHAALEARARMTTTPEEGGS